MSGANGYGDRMITAKGDLAAHDATPPLLRRAAAYAVTKFSSEAILEALAIGLGPREIVGSMVRRDRQRTLSDYGPSHPEAHRD